MDDERPVVMALVGYFAPPWGVVGRPKIVPLEDAAEYHALGFAVFVDPADEAALVAWEQRQRALRPKRKWYER